MSNNLNVKVTAHARDTTTTKKGNARFMTSLSRPARPAAAHPSTIDCGQTIFPIPAPMTFAAAKRSRSASDVPTDACSAPKRTFVLVPEPVTKPPSAPTIPETAAYPPPVAATRPYASVCVNPAATIVFASASTVQIVSTARE